MEEFRPFCLTHENVLDPLFEVQNKLRVAAMGPAFWDGMARRKIELSHGHSVELAELMVRVSDEATALWLVCSHPSCIHFVYDVVGVY